MISLLRHNQTVQREEDGAIQFWRIKFHLRNQLCEVICDRSGTPEDTEDVFLWIKEKRPVPTRSMINVCTKNLVLQIEQGNLINCLKTFASSMLTMEQGNL